MEANHLQKRNMALQANGNFVNGRLAQIAITPRGSDFYFAICAAMTVATFVFIGLALRKPRKHRIFHYITAAVTMAAAISYFSMGSNLGFTPIEVEFPRTDHRVSGQYREVFYVRYIDWFITTPLLLLDLLLTAGMPWPTILWVIFVDWVMIITGLIGALVQSQYKWGYYVFGCAALFYIVYQLAWESRRHANAIGSDVGRTFLICGSLTTILWIMYPICWGLSEGGNVIAPDSEAVFYGVLDFLAKPVFGALLIWSHRNIDPARLGLRIRDYDMVPTSAGEAGGPSVEKQHHPHAASSPLNGHNYEVTTGRTNGAVHPANGTFNGTTTATTV